uniref:Complexin-1 n=1 Tax=Maylandia zebra TaxID=106582 RepID=A0A3P9DF70_9CICH
ISFISQFTNNRATKDMGKMLGGEEEKDPDAQKKEEERQEALRQQEEEEGQNSKNGRQREKTSDRKIQGLREQLEKMWRYGIKKKEEKEAEAAAAMEQASEGSLTRPKKAVPAGCGDEEEEESIVDTVMKFIPAPLMDMFNKK